ncbi:MAG: hypothetical protein V4598_13005 [Bdellovibrionota bacterium]
MTIQKLLPGFVLGVFFLLLSCAEAPVSDPNRHDDGVYKTTLVTGRFEGFDDYKDWVVYLKGYNYKSVVYKVEASGAFHINAVNIPPGEYRLFFGKMRKDALGSMKFRIESLRTHLGIIQAGH